MAASWRPPAQAAEPERERPRYLPRRPAVATRYPQIHRGEQRAARLIHDILARRGTLAAELAEDLRVPRNLVMAWLRGDRAIHLGHVMAIQNRRLKVAILLACLAAAERDSEHGDDDPPTTPAREPLRVCRANGAVVRAVNRTGAQ